MKKNYSMIFKGGWIMGLFDLDDDPLTGKHEDSFK